MKLKLSVIAAFTAAHVALAADKYPVNVEIDLVFPQNGTYNIVADFPVVFAVQNADPFLTWKPYFSWEVRSSNNTSERPDAQSSVAVRGSLPSDIVHNMWWVASSAGKSNELPPGQYTMNWTLSIVTCTANGRLRSSESQKFLNGTMSFKTVSDGSGKNVDFTTDCPLYQGTVRSSRIELSGQNLLCPYITRNEAAKKNACRAKVWESMAACITHNLTHYNTKDFAPCQKAIDNAPKDIGGGVSDDGGSAGGSEDGKNGTDAGDKKDKDGAAVMYGVSSLLLGSGLALAMSLGL